ncbi:sugar transferase [Thermanaerothrix daxensis]|uniref:sugar transferase n=1 Tax=Thermanaerothrix daxensis TaxID=869279 RepID=UPI0009F93247|nr:sugar transferase [Thermanaerothrix daxensis]
MEKVIYASDPEKSGTRVGVSVVRQIDDWLSRIRDIIISGLGMIFLSPFFLLVVLMIRRDSPGPIFYKGPRVGKNGRVFKILKFRTMYEHPTSFEGARVTAKDDPRITPLGRFLRETKLNELPQLWNVFIGDMSLVGPRPEDPDIAARWPEDIRREILSVRPGITSPASVLYRNEEEMLQSRNVMERYLWDILPSKLRLDQLYVRNRSIWTDFDVLFWTAVVLLPRLKNYVVPEHLLYWGPLARFLNRYLIWFLADFVVAFFAIGIAGVLRRLSGPLDLGIELSLGIAFIIAMMFSLINALTGINRVEWSRAGASEAIDLAVSTGLVTLILFLINLFLPNGTLLPPIVLVAAGMFAYIGFVAVRYRNRVITGLAERWLRVRGDRVKSLGERVLIVGAGQTARFGLWLLRNGDLSKAFTLVGFVDDNPRKIGAMVEGLPVVGRTDQIPALVQKHDVGLILFAISDIRPDHSERILTLCRQPGVRLIMMPEVMDTLRAHFPVSEQSREELAEKVLRNTLYDRLTNVYNQQHFMRLLEREAQRAQRYHNPLSLIIFKVSYPWPDEATRAASVTAQILKAVAERTLRDIREVDAIGRLEESVFGVLLPETSIDGANLVAERLQVRLCSAPVWTDRGPISVEVGMGVACLDDDGGHEGVFERAYQAMKIAVNA